jgi:hypothetical protein
MTSHAERMARLQRLLDMLAQVRKQATDLTRMARELHAEARQSIQLATETANDVGRGGWPSRQRKATPTGKKKRRATAGRRNRSKV